MSLNIFFGKCHNLYFNFFRLFDGESSPLLSSSLDYSWILFRKVINLSSIKPLESLDQDEHYFEHIQNECVDYIHFKKNVAEFNY